MGLHDDDSNMGSNRNQLFLDGVIFTLREVFNPRENQEQFKNLSKIMTYDLNTMKPKIRKIIKEMNSDAPY